jgi:hypothetical protein
MCHEIKSHNIQENSQYQVINAFIIILFYVSTYTVHSKCINDLLLCIERLLCPSVTNIDLGATFPGANMVQGKNTLGYLRTRTFYTPILRLQSEC